MTIAILPAAFGGGRSALARTVATLDPVRRLLLIMGTCVFAHCVGGVVFANAGQPSFDTVVHLIDAILVLAVLAYIGVSGIRSRGRRLEMFVTASLMTGFVVAVFAGVLAGYAHAACCCVGC